MTTKTCTKCGVDKQLDEYTRDKRASDGRRSECKACVATRNAAYRDANREKVARWRASYRDANRETLRVRNAAYFAANPHIGWARAYRRRARAFGFPIVQEDFTREDVVSEYGDRCAHCINGPFEELDHLVAVRDGGAHVLSGVRPSCRPCNLRREQEAAKARKAAAATA
ncbi:hypothetical protein CK505_12530 [Kocuria sp. WN036]|uniref:HNH endonuclease n=1 Tax=Kocuria sp. WN036 TaxID=2032628 RepID=UPI000BAC0A10|nr:HNH endonuclease signature motif containing protein [Kocuria sp. WN036]PAU90099.1 hypothetical protein CK505_12530 [Kocuria sp. WN036]